MLHPDKKYMYCLMYAKADWLGYFCGIACGQITTLELSVAHLFLNLYFITYFYFTSFNDKQTNEKNCVTLRGVSDQLLRYNFYSLSSSRNCFNR